MKCASKEVCIPIYGDVEEMNIAIAQLLSGSLWWEAFIPKQNIERSTWNLLQEYAALETWTPGPPIQLDTHEFLRLINLRLECYDLTERFQPAFN